MIPSFIATPLSSFREAYTEGEVSYCNGTDLEFCAVQAAAADVAIVFAGTLSGEGSDRLSLSLDDGIAVNNQNELITKVAQAQPNTVVVLSVPGAILCPWEPLVKGIVTNFMPGQQAGNAITDVLLGAVNPSAKLPITFPNMENETQFAPDQWPGVPDAPLPSPKTDPRQLCEDVATPQNFVQGFGEETALAAAPPPTPPVCKFSNYTEHLLVGYRYCEHPNVARCPPLTCLNCRYYSLNCAVGQCGGATQPTHTSWRLQTTTTTSVSLQGFRLATASRTPLSPTPISRPPRQK